jgi:type II secretory pathway pseudopilin PulG
LKIKKIHFFNMIEIILALTIIAIGMTSILGLFPVGLNASRNAIAQNVSADVADQMITYLSIINESIKIDAFDVVITPTNYDNNIKTINTSAYQIAKFSDADVIEAQSLAFLTKYKADAVSKSSAEYPRIADGWAIFKNTAVATLEPQMFFVVQGPNCAQDGGNRNIDYSAMALVWKSTVRINCLKPDGDPGTEGDWRLWPEDAEFATTPYKYSGKLNIELSWPLHLPYKDRKKRYYQVVISNPNP